MRSITRVQVRSITRVQSRQREGELPTERANWEKSQSLAYVIPSGKGHTSNYVCSVRSKPDSSGCTNVKKINKSEIKACTVILNWALWELYNASAHLWIGDLRSCYEHFGQFYRNTKTWIMSISVNFIETPKHGCGGNCHIKGNIRSHNVCLVREFPRTLVLWNPTTPIYDRSSRPAEHQLSQSKLSSRNWTITNSLSGANAKYLD